MIPLRDVIPSRTTPWVTMGLIAVNVLALDQEELSNRFAKAWARAQAASEGRERSIGTKMERGGNDLSAARVAAAMGTASFRRMSEP